MKRSSFSRRTRHPVRHRVTSHGQRRRQQRGITDRAISLTLDYGDRFYVGGGRLAYYLSRQAIARCSSGPNDLHQYQNIAVIVQQDTEITSYKTTRLPKFWRPAR